jgi:hypothetical protein
VTRHVKLEKTLDKKIVALAKDEQRSINNMLVVLLTEALECRKEKSHVDLP